jgi:AcrR family transcriptional regulator
MSRNALKNTRTLEAKRKQILSAGIRVFAKKGYHHTRVSEIAKEAGVAYGLIYHYFKNKKDILNTIFQEKWCDFTLTIEELIEKELPLKEKLYKIVSFIIDGYMDMPELMDLLILELARSPKFLEKQNLKLFEKTFLDLEELLKIHQRKGSIRQDLDARLLSYIFFGAVESTITGIVMKSLSKNKEQLEEYKKGLVSVFLNGLLKNK